MVTVIQLSVVSPPAFFDSVPPKSRGEGLRMVYAEDVLYQGHAAGTHSGVLTTLRTNLPTPGPFQGENRVGSTSTGEEP
jgi:hypothetical protein